MFLHLTPAQNMIPNRYSTYVSWTGMDFLKYLTGVEIGLKEHK